MIEPAPHATHTPAAPLAFTYEPAAHATQLVWPTRPSVVLPDAHAKQLTTDESVEYVFTPHATHDVAPTLVWPVYEPAAHATHSPDPLAQYVPSAHETQLVWPTRPAVQLPAAHAVQLVTFDATEYVLLPHARHNVAPPDALPV